MMNWQRWQPWFNREKITLFIAGLALTLGAISPWYHLPVPTLAKFGVALAFEPVARMLAGVLAIFCFAGIFFSCDRAPRFLFWGGLIAALLFPYVVITWFPTIAFITTSYYDQGIRITVHLQNNFPEVQTQWKQNILLDRPRLIPSVLPFTIEDSRFFQLSSWDLLFEGFGYSNVFWECIGRGWGMTVIGNVIALLAIYLGLATEKYNALLKDLKKIVPGVGLLISLLVGSLLIPNIINYQLDTMFAQGKYYQVVNISQTLEKFYPPLGGDTNFLQRQAEAGFYSDQPKTDLIYFAKGLEHYQQYNFATAENYFRQSLALNPQKFLVRGYLATSILNQGVEAFNLRKPGNAGDRFTEVLQVFPNHVEALYDLMLAKVVNNDFVGSASVAGEIIETEKSFQLPNLGLLGQAYLHSAWASYQAGDLSQAWEKYRQSIDKSKWK